MGGENKLEMRGKRKTKRRSERKDEYIFLHCEVYFD
jgi:hypothetical protein